MKFSSGTCLAVVQTIWISGLWRPQNYKATAFLHLCVVLPDLYAKLDYTSLSKQALAKFDSTSHSQVDTMLFPAALLLLAPAALASPAITFPKANEYKDSNWWGFPYRTQPLRNVLT